MKKSLKRRNSKRILILFFLLMVLFLVFIVGYSICFGSSKVSLNKNIKDNQDIVSISYVGDLQVLMDQVSYSYDEDNLKYDFSYMFERVNRYFADSDYTIGVFGGLVESKKKSKYGDSNNLYLKVLEDFSGDVKASGVDFVSMANNHLLDNGLEGVYKTIDYFNEINLQNTGSYKNNIDKNKIEIIEVQGIKIAVLAYTFGVDNYNDSYFLEDNPSITSIIVPEASKYFERVKDKVKDDFSRASEMGADLIMVMPHRGTEITDEDYELQNVWNDIFISLGADIILGDYSCTVQKVEFVNDTLVVNSPGSFTNFGDDNDVAMVEFYVSKSKKEVKGVGIVPMYTKEIAEGKYQVVPIYDIYTDDELYNSFSKDELESVKEVQKKVTSSMIGKEVDVTRVQERYFIFKEKYDDISLVEALNESSLKEILDNASSVTFIGDSITHGTVNGHHGWQEPLMKLYPDVEVNNISEGTYTTRKMLNDFSDDIKNSDSDLYFIALGTNDIRYRNEKICSMTEEEYIKNIDKIISLIGNKEAKIVLIAPWNSLANDLNSHLSYTKRVQMMNKYALALEEYADLNNYIYVDANKYIDDFFKSHNAFNYLIDYIHPNSTEGIKLYSYAVLLSTIS